MKWETPHQLFARQALTEQGWQRNVLVSLKDGVIADIVSAPSAPTDALSFDLLLPGIANVHSHAFQHAMAGLTEAASPKGRDNFWTWRELMYAFANALTPAQIEIIASALYIQLLKHGYTAVGEFHYLHNDPAGKPYATVTELSDRVIAAALATGLHITHLPVLYECSDFGGIAPLEKQRRFIHTPDSYLKLVDSLVQRYGKVAGVSFGVAPHSLRAAKPDSLQTVLQALPGLGLGSCPIHIHVAEQEKEVRDCLAWSGKRPVHWLLDNMPVDARWCLIHATHSSPEELEKLIRSDAAVGLCPNTEGNLGDGIFPADAFVMANGRFCIGSDSNCCVSPFEELRLMEYAQRLTLRRRAVLASEATPSVGRTLYAAAGKNGAKALDLHTGVLAPGWRADLLTLSTDNAMFAGKEGDRTLDTLIFASSPPQISDVFVEGRRVVTKGKHTLEDESVVALRQVMQEVCRAI